MPYTFRALYPGLDVPPADPLLRRILTACEAARLDPDQVNSTINAIMSRALVYVEQTGQPMSAAAFLAIASEHAAPAGFDFKVVQDIAGQFAQGDTGAGDPPTYDDARLLELEEFLTAQLEAGQITEAEFHRLFDAGQDIKGVEYISKLKDFAEGKGSSPGPFPKTSSTGNDSQQEAATMTDNHYPRVTDGPRHTETPEQAQARREHEGLRAKKNSVYSLMNDPRYSSPGSEGEVFRAEVARKFEEVFGSEASAGRSEAGLGT